MGYTVKWRQKVLDELEKLPKVVSKRIVRKIDSAKEEPHHFLERLACDPGYKLRVGDYRIIIDIIEHEKILAIRTVGHRRNIYEKNL